MNDNRSIAQAPITAEEAFWIMMPTFGHRRKECAAQIEKWNAEWEPADVREAIKWAWLCYHTLKIYSVERFLEGHGRRMNRSA
jgi:hypothetical protein